MALITAHHLTSNVDEDDKSTYTTASISPTSNRLVLLTVTNAALTTASVPTITGGGMTTWTIVDSIGTNTNTCIFRALQDSPSSGTVSIAYGGVTQARCFWSITEFANINTSGTNGSGAIVQSNTDSTSSASISGVTITLDPFASNKNATFGGVRTSGLSTNISPGDGFTELSENDSIQRMQTQWKDNPDTSVDWTWTTATVSTQTIAVEIRAEAESAGFFALL